MNKRPNILLLLNDHQAYYRHGWDGGVRPRIPSFDRLAAEGLRFDRAYCPTALCVPARRSLWTGLYPHNHGLYSNDESLPESPASWLFPLMAERGYRPFYYGKWHNGAMRLWKWGCGGFSMPGYGNPYQSAEYRRYCAELGIAEARCRVEADMDCDPARSGDRDLKDLDFMRDKGSGLLLTPEESHEAFFLAHLAGEKLAELARCGSDEPWIMVVSFWGPHRPYLPTERYASMYRAEDIGEYPSFRADLSDKPASHRCEHNPVLQDGRGNLVQPSRMPWSWWQSQLARCYAHVTMVDAAGGRLLARLDELGLAAGTCVVWTTDHGDAVASHGGHGTKGPPMTEEIYRVPLAVRWPGTVEPGRSTGALVSHIDLAPTFLNLAASGNKGAGARADGASLLPLLAGDADRVREDLMCEFQGLGIDLPRRYGKPEYHARALVTDRFKYVRTLSDLEELYDLEADPYQTTNLHRAQEHRALLRDLRRRLAVLRHGSGDRFAV